MSSLITLPLPRPIIVPHAQYHARTHAPQTSPGKTSARAKLLDLVSAHFAGQTRIKTLSLPGVWWIFERALLRQFPDSPIIGVEREWQTFRASVLHMPKKGVLHHCQKARMGNAPYVRNTSGQALIYGDVFAYLTQKRERDLDLIWLDLMGMTTEAFLQALDQCVRVLRPNGMLAFNILQGRELPEILKRIQMFDSREEFLIAHLAVKGFTCIQAVRYADGSNRAVRIQMAFTKGIDNSSL